ncbi:MAG TPA: efflux RND transporter periplasmic adaptor subunit [Candidatus Dormibacteraeota bacterium]|nr:efflux RND transporter periplasmic adaptor subunit [Candidatus Dormibacteraeota bacterium]
MLRIKFRSVISKAARTTLAATAAVSVLAACGKKPAQGPPPLVVDAAAAARQNVATYLSLDGQIAPLNQSTLAFQQSGTIMKINVNIGDMVRKGQLLATIDPRTLEAQLAQARAQAAQASASAQGSVVGYPVQVQTNDAAVQTAKASLENAKLVYDQNKQLYKQGYVSETTLQQSQANYVQAQQAYNNSVVGLRNNAVSFQNVKSQQAQAAAAAAQADVLSTQLSQTFLYSPYDAVVANRLVDPGAYASPSQPVLQVARVDRVWINVNVPDEDLPYVHPGINVTYQSTSLPGHTFTGPVQTVNLVPTAGTLSYLARLEVQNPGYVLRGGMLVTVTVTKAHAVGAVVVPRSAVAQTPNGSVVYVVADNKAQAVPVRIGVQTDTMSQVISPRVQPGTMVITTRPDALKDGSVVAVSNGNAPSSNGAVH